MKSLLINLVKFISKPAVKSWFVYLRIYILNS